MRTLILVVLLLPASASADILINEIAWMGTEVEEVDSGQWWRYEWVELYNSGNEDVSLSGWTMEFLRDDQDLLISLGGSIAPEGHFVAGASDLLPVVHGNYDNLGGRMHNSGQLVVLRDGSGEVVDALDAREEWFAGENSSKRTMERRYADHDTNDPDNWGTGYEEGGTPGNENSVSGVSSQEEKMLIEGTKKGDSAPFFSNIRSFFSQAFLTALSLALLSALLAVFLRSWMLERQQA